MDEIESSYSREQALADGVLIDVTEVVRDCRAEIPYPTAVSAGLWNHPLIERDSNKVRDAIERGVRSWIDAGRPAAGTFVNPVPMWVREQPGSLDAAIHFLRLTMVVQPCEASIAVVTFVVDDESADFRCPRPPGGALYLM